MRLVVLGAPGAGKGTQARRLAEYYKSPHVSTGDILRDEMNRDTPVGKSVAQLMGRGNLVPDEVVIDIIKSHIRHDSFILDGFPRTLYQARKLDELTEKLGTPLHRAVFVSVSDDIIVERMTGRIVCPACGAMYHTTHYPPKVSGKCKCGNNLIQREDDKTETVLKRLTVYHDLTEPIIGYYKDKNMLLTVDGTKDMKEITNSIVTALKEGL